MNNNLILFEKQKETLDIFLSKGAISKEQYDKSLTTLKDKLLSDSPSEKEK